MEINEEQETAVEEDDLYDIVHGTAHIYVLTYIHIYDKDVEVL